MDFLQHLLQQVLSQNLPAITNLEALFGVVAVVAVYLAHPAAAVAEHVAQFLCLQALCQQLQL
jgi:hypothetical protein